MPASFSREPAKTTLFAGAPNEASASFLPKAPQATLGRAAQAN